MGFIIETPLSPHMAGQATRLIARDSRLLNMARRASRSNSKGEKPCTFFSKKREPICPLPTQSKSVTSKKHDPICAISVQRVPLVSLAPRISWTNVEPTSKHDPRFAMSVQSKYSVRFS